RARRRELAGAVLHREVAEVVLKSERDIGVADRAGRLRDEGGHAGAALAAVADGPVDARAPSDLRLPRRADTGEVVGEVVRRARAVGAVGDRDLRARQADALVELLDRGVVPGRDLPHEDLRE